ncbi:MAG: pyridoxal-phosphate dependent enzyme [candidate division Zixibacteria bacterium]|nr:pyridoxal-phosphate dependent enzyme [candidate division Zixibacteria bacterium]
MSLKLPPKVEIAFTPTPIEKLENLPFELTDYEIYIKRDDLTGSTLQGNKIRKLEYFLAESEAREVDIWISCGGLQSNHCRAVACLASMKNIKSYLMLRGNQPSYPEGNYLLDKLVGAEIEFVSAADYFHIDEIMLERSEKLRSKGINPMIIPEGGSNPLGLCGYFDCYNEIREQLKAQEFSVDYIITATGSGGTYGGLIAGSKFHQDDSEIIGINVCYTSEHFVNRIHGYICGFSENYCPELVVDKSDIRIVDGYVGKGYALSRPEELEMIYSLARNCGLIFDPVYTGKAFFGIVDMLKKRLLPAGSRILFIHTGGLWGLMSIGGRFLHHNLI